MTRRYDTTTQLRYALEVIVQSPPAIALNPECGAMKTNQIRPARRLDPAITQSTAKGNLHERE
jgi:hypothetical protein